MTKKRGSTVEKKLSDEVLKLKKYIDEQLGPRYMVYLKIPISPPDETYGPPDHFLKWLKAVIEKVEKEVNKVRNIVGGDDYLHIEFRPTVSLINGYLQLDIHQMSEEKTENLLSARLDGTISICDFWLADFNNGLIQEFKELAEKDKGQTLEVLRDFLIHLFKTTLHTEENEDTIQVQKAKDFLDILCLKSPGESDRADIKKPAFRIDTKSTGSKRKGMRIKTPSNKMN